MVMNDTLKQAVERVSQLPEADQKRIAAIILEELSDEAAWDEAFEKSQPALEQLAKEASEEYHAGRTEPLDPDTL
jgi:hypothetical protein